MKLVTLFAALLLTLPCYYSCYNNRNEKMAKLLLERESLRKEMMWEKFLVNKTTDSMNATDVYPDSATRAILRAYISRHLFLSSKYKWQSEKINFSIDSLEKMK